MWTEKEDAIFIKVLQLHGRDYKKLREYFPALTYRQIYIHVTLLKDVIQADNKNPDSHLQKVLARKPSWHWSKKEEETFVTMFKKYGKNYRLIKAKIPTKTLKQVSSYGYCLHKKIEANPKHKHFALKKKLKPISKSAPWT